MTRRLLIGAGMAAAGFLASPAWAHTVPEDAPRRLSFIHRHTDEKIDVVYWDEGWYLPDALREVNRLLRDFRTGEIREIDVRLLDTLFRIHVWLGATQPYHVLSGYRSPQTNAMLREAGQGTAINSLHMKGMAIDLWLPGRSIRSLRRAAVHQESGGIGYYPSHGFVHLDVGRVRYWRG